ncbi:FAD-dependent monooxygenase [Pelagibacterales bacterium SAG-MED15]|nr:FAD-dependent monooxygenase [Pelagibacterales bacterium SAG-MED15]
MKKIAIIGAGISGLFIANLFKKNPYYHFTIYEKNNVINLDEGYGIQLSVNSIKLLNEIGFDKLEFNKKFNPENLDIYSINETKKICELEISKFNSEDCRYTTLKRSVLTNFLIKDLGDHIITGSKISKIDQFNQKIKLTFENNKKSEYDHLIISDGVFSKSKGLISKSKIQPKYNNTLAIRGSLNKVPNYINDKNISLFLYSNFHFVIYPINSNGDLNFIAIMKYKMSSEDQKNYSLFTKDTFIKNILEKTPPAVKDITNNLEAIRIFPVFVSDNYYKLQNKNIHLIGDAFFAFPPSFAQGASQSIEGAYELFENIKNNTEANFLNNRLNKTKMINNRSKLNQFVFHLSNPLTIFFRNYLLKKLVKNEKFLETYLGKIYK